MATNCPLSLVVSLIAVFLPTRPLFADKIVLKQESKTLTVEGTIEEFNAVEVVFQPEASEHDVHEPVSKVLQITSPKEPELSAAEQAYADGKWSDAATLYHRTLGFSASDWAKYRAAVRLIDSAGKNLDFELQVEAYIKLARLDPVNAQARQPKVLASYEAVGAALKKVLEEVASNDSETKLALLPFLAELHNPRPRTAGPKELVELSPTDAKMPGIGPHGPVFGNGGNAHDIVFVIDASRSMLQKSATLKDQIQQTISRLNPTQAFNIVFFQDQGCSAVDKAHLVMANASNKRNAYKFLDDVTFPPTTDPVPGLKLAFEQHPQLIYLLTDGDFSNNRATEDLILKLNNDRTVRINTIAFTNDPETGSDFFAVLNHIARENGGVFRNVMENELNQ